MVCMFVTRRVRPSTDWRYTLTFALPSLSPGTMIGQFYIHASSIDMCLQDIMHMVLGLILHYEYTKPNAIDTISGSYPSFSGGGRFSVDAVDCIRVAKPNHQAAAFWKQRAKVFEHTADVLCILYLLRPLVTRDSEKVHKQSAFVGRVQWFLKRNSCQNQIIRESSLYVCNILESAKMHKVHQRNVQFHNGSMVYMKTFHDDMFIFTAKRFRHKVSIIEVIIIYFWRQSRFDLNNMHEQFVKRTTFVKKKSKLPGNSDTDTFFAVHCRTSN